MQEQHLSTMRLGDATPRKGLLKFGAVLSFDDNTCICMYDLAEITYQLPVMPYLFSMHYPNSEGNYKVKHEKEI